MDVLWDALRTAVSRLARGDDETVEILLLSLRVSLAATALACLGGMPLGALLAVSQRRGRGLSLALVNTGMAVPPVVVGLVVTLLLWRGGPLGALGLLYTPTAMTIAQAVIATPLVMALSAAAVASVDPDFRVQMRGLGAGPWRSLLEVAREARLGLVAAAIAGFGAAVSEVGAALMVGGNIAGETRVLTTAAVLDTSRGDFGSALAYGLILLAFAFSVVAALTYAQHRDRFAPR